MGSIPEVTLSSGTTMPLVGFGTASYPLADADTVKTAVLAAIRAGYRHFDTAFTYRSEPPLADAIAEALRLGLIKSRSELHITSKLWCSDAEKDLVVPALKMTLRNLQLEYLDLYLIHFPVRLIKKALQSPIPKEYILPFDLKSVWEAMEECQNLGLTKSIGVSNFSCKKLGELLSFAKIPPAVNQVEMNPVWQQKQLREFCNAKRIHITAYSPLGANGTKWGDNRVLTCDVLEEIAKRKGKTPAQVALRWIYEQGVSVVVKSFNKERMEQNLQIFNWSLTEEDTNKISQLPQRKGVLFVTAFGPHDSMKELDEEI